MRSPSRLLALVVLLASVILGSVFSLIHQELNRVAIVGEDRSFSVVPGASLRSTLNELSAEQVLQHPRLIEEWARWQYGSQFGLKAGRYLFPAGSSGRDILEQLRLGKVQMEQITLIEGWNFDQFRHALDLHPGLTHIWQALSPAQLMEQLGSPGMHPEGRFFPDTYRFAAGTTDSTVYRLAFQRMQQELSRAWQERAPELGLRNPEEMLALASIIEKETGREDERGRVAGVFVNRLHIGMRLQSDPTVIYGLGTNYDGDIRRRDLLTDTPYNTYTREGLPPTPIAMPGAASLRAAAQPDKTAALYFVATGDGDGSHHFSVTLAEHNAAVARLVRKQRGAR